MLCLENNFDIFALTETFLIPEFADTDTSIPGYSFYRNDRVGKPGGGVGVFIKDCFIVKVLHKSEQQYTKKPEFLILDIRHGSNKILFAVVYRPPHATYPFHFFKLLSQFLPSYSNVVVTGDFNIDLTVSNDASAHLLDAIQSCSLFLVPSDPTHHTMYRDRPSHTWLDLFILRDKSLLDSYNKSVSPIVAGHDLISLKLKFSKGPSKASTLKLRNFKKLNLDLLGHTLDNKLDVINSRLLSLSADYNNFNDSCQLLKDSSVDFSLLAKATSNAILSSFDLAAPLITIKNASKQKPWVSNEIREIMKERDKSYKIAKQSNLHVDFMKFRFLRNRVSNSLSTAKNAYFASRLKAAPDLNTKWHELRKLGIATKKNDTPFKYFSGSTLNAHFGNVSRKLPPLRTAEVQEILDNFPPNSSLPLFNFNIISYDEVLSAINSSISKTFGVDLISSKMLKFAGPFITNHLCQMFNMSLQSGIFPEEWKQTLISPLLKKTPPDSPSDTRPIARLSEVSKVLERIVHKQLLSFLIKNDLLDQNQSGFRPGRNTQSALLEVLEFARLGIENRQLTILVPFDSEKALDSIFYSVLLQSLHLLNCSDMVLKWFVSYLSKRKQAVVTDDNIYSEWLETFTGVPKGSVLGPLLFLIFINDLHRVLSVCKHTLFADDLQIYLHCHHADLDAGIQQINNEINAVFKWAEEKKMRLNLKKTKIMILGSKGYVPNIDLNSLRSVIVNNAVIPFVSEIRNLGLTLTPSLSWERHVSTILSSGHRILFTLRRAKHVLNFSLRKYLVESLIFHHFDYVCTCLTDFDFTLNLKLQRL